VAATVVAVCSGLAVLVAAHVMINARLLRRLGPAGMPEVRVAVLLPVRDEVHRVEPCLRSLLALDGEPEVLVLDDGSTDGTGDLVRGLGFRVIDGAPLPDGWLGKPHACHQLAAATDAEVILFVDADVVLEPDAVARAVAALQGVDLLTPYPRIVATGLGQRLVQPLLQWSWLAFLPLRAMERSRRPSLAAAGGQFLVVRRAAYLAAGGHAGVRDRVLEDIELARAVKRAGGRIALADGSDVATCRMYDSWPQLVDGYTKSLWASFGSAAGAVAVVAMLVALFVVPVIGLILSPIYAFFGVLAGVISRIVAARATGGRAWPDALGHPVSVLLFGWLVARSFRRRRSVTWKGRPVT
jgi:cellulose synthase/poly-beta-1,6-N-acetylglucosamine synthase-like glycosyltransferase